jgi:hypothetical protein
MLMPVDVSSGLVLEMLSFSPGQAISRLFSGGAYLHSCRHMLGQYVSQAMIASFRMLSNSSVGAGITHRYLSPHIIDTRPHTSLTCSTFQHYFQHNKLKHTEVCLCWPPKPCQHIHEMVKSVYVGHPNPANINMKW